MKYKLKKDIVIPAGTELAPAPSKTERSDGHLEAIIGLGKDGYASFVFDAESPEGKDLISLCSPEDQRS